MLKKYQNDKIPNYLKKYIRMCEKAKDILDSDHYFEEDEFFFHPNIGINIVDKITSDDRFYIPSKTEKINMKECIWLPTEDKLKELADSMNLDQGSLENFLKDNNGYPKGKKPSKIFNLPEEKWLAYYMLERHNMIWSQEKNKWIKKDFF